MWPPLDPKRKAIPDLEIDMFPSAQRLVAFDLDKPACKS